MISINDIDGAINLLQRSPSSNRWLRMRPKSTNIYTGINIDYSRDASVSSYGKFGEEWAQEVKKDQ